MQPKRKNLTLYRGDSYELVITHNVPQIDTVSCQVRTKPDAKVQIDITNDDITRTDDKIIIKIKPEHTANATYRLAYYDVQITHGDDVMTILAGQIELEHDITKGA